MSQTDLADEKLTGSSTRLSVTKSIVSATVADGSRPQNSKIKNDSGATSGVPFPEGGLAGWATVAGAFFVQMCGFGYTTSFGVYQDYYKRVYLIQESPAAISWIGSINSLLIISSGIFFGRLYDRGYFYHLLYGGSLLLAFSLFMHSLTKPGQYYQVLLSQGIGAGLGAGAIYIPSIAVIAHYFQKRRALAMTIVASGSSLGAIVHPIMLNNMLNNPSFGFATAARANAGMIAGLLLISCLLMRTRLEPPKNTIDLWAAARKFAKDTPFVFTTLGMSTFVMGLYFPLFYLQLDALTHDLDKSFSFYALVILNASSFFGRLAPGFVVNRFGVEKILVASVFVCAVLILSMIALKTVASVIVIAITYGFSAGVYITLLAPWLAVLADDISELGARMGVAFFFCGIGSLIGTPIEGSLLTGNYIWCRPAVFGGVMSFVGFGFYVTSLILLRRRRRRQQALETEQSTTGGACVESDEA